MSVAIINKDSSPAAAVQNSVPTAPAEMGAPGGTATSTAVANKILKSSTSDSKSSAAAGTAAATTNSSLNGCSINSSAKQNDIFADFHAFAKDGQRLFFDEFSQLLKIYDNSSPSASHNPLPAVKFLLADQGNKGYLTLKDWTKYIASMNQPYSFEESENETSSIADKLFDKFQISKHFNNNAASSSSIKKLNDALTNHYRYSDNYNPQFFADRVEQFLINELVSAKILLFFEANKDLLAEDESVPWSKMVRFTNDLFSNKIDSKFINHVLSYRNDSHKFDLSEIQNKINLLSKYQQVNKFLANSGRKPSPYLSNYDLSVISQYPQGESILISPPGPILVPPTATSWKIWKSHSLAYIEPIYNFSLGAISGAVGASLVYPIDTVKTSMQAQSTSLSSTSDIVYKNSLDCLQKLVRQGGILRLYSGISAQLTGIAPEKAIKLTVNDLVRNYAKNRQSSSVNGGSEEIPLRWQMLAGCCAGAAQVAVTNPLEIVKIRLQMTQKIPVAATTTIVAASRPAGAIQIVSELGLSGLYKGVAACLLRDIPFSCIYFPTYSFLKESFLKYNKKYSSVKENSLEFWQLLTAGGLAGCPAAFFTTPFDVIKTRLQMKQGSSTIAKVSSSTGASEYPIAYKGVKDAAIKIYSKEGPTAFFKGSIARVCRSSPQFGFTLACYEILQENISFDSVFLKDNENKTKTDKVLR